MAKKQSIAAPKEADKPSEVVVKSPTLKSSDPLIKTMTELRAMSDKDKDDFRKKNGTVIEG